MHIKYIDLNLLNNLRTIDPLTARVILGIDNIQENEFDKIVVILTEVLPKTSNLLSTNKLKMIFHQLFSVISIDKVNIINKYNGSDLAVIAYLNSLKLAIKQKADSQTANGG